MKFYPDVKDGMSPSALAQWLNSRAAFVKSYFMGEKSPETAAMKGGTMIHKLIEAGLIKAKHVFEASEQDLSVLIEKGVVFRGRPDSFELEADETGTIHFVDYKSGKANDWAEKLPTDIKMRATAWLVWRCGGMPERVVGYIEYIQTTWNPETKAIEPVDGKETEVIEIEYSADEMETFSKVILREMANVDDFYQRWQKSTGEFVDKDEVARYAEIHNTIEKLEAEAETLKESIQSQMEFGGEENHKTEFGTFYLTTKETYDYPEELGFKVDGEAYTLAKADKVTAQAKAAKKNFELANEPVSTKTSIGFRTKKDK